MKGEKCLNKRIDPSLRDSILNEGKAYLQVLFSDYMNY